MENNRTRKVYINSIATLVGQVLQVILGFVVRKLFLNYIGVEYLGYNSVFLNILQLLNLADMGIGVAVTSFLYKPLANNNRSEIATLMCIYKRLYSVMGIIVLSIGMLTIPFLPMLIPDAKCSLGFLVLIYLINLAGTVSTYFLAYKRTLIIADQKSYITNIIDTSLFFGVSILQLIGMLVYPNYIVYISLNLVRNVGSNIVLSIRADRMYGNLYRDANPALIAEYKPKIYQYIKDLFVSRIGAVIYYSTDNVILSVLKGSLLTGYLSNYTLITTQLNTVVVQIFGSLQATFGNYISTNEELEKQRKMTDNYFCVNFTIGNFCFICFSLLAQPFVKMFFGENMLLWFSTALWLGINLMLTFLIQLPSQVFTIYKLFRFDRPIIITSAALNIVISVILVKYIGINGVLIGTFVTSLICLFSRFYVISKRIYNVSYLYYIKKIAFYGMISVASFFICYFISNRYAGEGIIGFGIKAVVVAVLSLLTTAMLLSFTREFQFLINKLIPGKLKRFATKPVIVGLTVVLCIATFIVGGRITTLNKDGFLDAGNKSYQRTDSYIVDSKGADKIFHLSFDDTVCLFKDITRSNPRSIFDIPNLAWMKEVHDRYGVVISCYTYYEDGDFNLSQVPDKYKEEFISNSDWLRFGFHTINSQTNYAQGEQLVADYNKTIVELKRIVGGESIDNFIRLQMFQGSYDEIKKLTELADEPVVGLLSADDNRKSYYLNEEQNKYLYSHDRWYDEELKLWMVSTDLRTEYVGSAKEKIKEFDTSAWNNQKDYLVIFTHEWALNVENQEKIEQFCKYAKENEYKFIFFEDLLMPTSLDN